MYFYPSSSLIVRHEVSFLFAILRDLSIYPGGRVRNEALNPRLRMG